MARLVWPRCLGITVQTPIHFPVEALKDEEEEREEERWARSQEASRASSSHWERWPLQGHLHHRPGHRFWKVGRGAGVEGVGADDEGEGPSGPRPDEKMFTLLQMSSAMTIPHCFFSFKEGGGEEFRPET